MPSLATTLATVPHNLAAAEAQWLRLRHAAEIPTVVSEASQPLGAAPEWDVVICGGTLGIILATVLQQQGWRVALIERGLLQGRDQEWNISRPELEVLTRLKVISPETLTSAIASEFNPVRVQFATGEPIWIRDVLNLGVSPKSLLAALKQQFLAAGGGLLEQTAFQGATVHPDAVAIATSSDTLTARLLIDAMGHFSPIQQQARQAQVPRGVCLVVGGCAQGLPELPSGDLIVTLTGIEAQQQYFWEAFPAARGRTTYCFTYVDTQPQRPSLEQVLNHYWQHLAAYQGCNPEDLQFERLIAGVFPSYSQTARRWPRLLAVGDSSGQQSPLSFGGFGAMLRHLPRLATGLKVALDCDRLQDLSLLQPYQPNMAVTWLFQQAMCVPVTATPSPDAINHLLDSVFQAMHSRGDAVLRPFVRDVIQFPALTQALAATLWQDPSVVAAFVQRVGLRPLMQWLPHYLALGGYSAAYPLARSWVSEAQALAWQYGAGLDLE